jgi:hypothetical protein
MLGVLKVVIATCAISLIAAHLSPATAAPAAQVITCVDLASGKERISKTDTCRTTEATAKWHLAPVDSALASGGTTKSLTICSNKESSPVTYQRIRTSCYKHMQTNLYARSSILPTKPVITQVSSASYESASLALASDLAANLDAPIAYYTITSSKGDVKKVNSWRELNVTISGLRSSTSYTFTITATSVDGTSPVSESSLPVTTQVYVAPVAVVTTPVALAYTVGQTGPGGGKVFYASNTQFACGPTLNLMCNFLEVAPASVINSWTDATYAWSGITGTSVGTTSTVVGSGYKNTLAIINQSSTALRAGTITQAYRGPNNLTDWYLASKDELNLLCQWDHGVASSVSTVCAGGAHGSPTFGADTAGLLADDYWSSSEHDASNAWYQFFGNSYLAMGIFPVNGGQQQNYVKLGPLFVRPIRAF